MGTPDAKSAVTHDNDNRQVRPGHFQPGSIGQGATMQAVKGMGVKEGVKKSCTAYIADDSDLLTGQFQGLQSPVKSMHDLLMGTARTKHRWPPCV
jgi:hypothetical protein